MDKEEFDSWINALDMYELIDWLLPEALEQDFISDEYNQSLAKSFNNDLGECDLIP